MRDPHQWSTVTRNDRFFVLFAGLVLMVILMPFAVIFGDVIGTLLRMLLGLPLI